MVQHSIVAVCDIKQKTTCAAAVQILLLSTCCVNKTNAKQKHAKAMAAACNSTCRGSSAQKQ